MILTIHTNGFVSYWQLPGQGKYCTVKTSREIFTPPLPFSPVTISIVAEEDARRMAGSCCYRQETLSGSDNVMRVDVGIGIGTRGLCTMWDSDARLELERGRIRQSSAFSFRGEDKSCMLHIRSNLDRAINGRVLNRDVENMSSIGMR